MMLESIDSNLDTPTGQALLRAAARKRLPVHWIGRGASGALAALATQLMSSMLMSSIGVDRPRLFGNDAPRDLHLNAVISASGTCPAPLSAILLTTARGAEQATSREPIPLIVGSEARLTEQWFPLAFCRACLHALSQTFHVDSAPGEAIDVHASANELLVIVDCRAEALQRLVYTAEDKVGPLRVRVINAEEFGHGLHARELRSPETFDCYALTRPSASPAMSRLLNWRVAHNLTTHTHSLRGESQTAYLLGTARLLLDLLEQRFTALGLDWVSRRIGDESDTLRG